MRKSILITGCSSGIGYMAAHELQKRGYHVIASCRKQSDVEKLISEGLTCIQLDVTDSDSIDRAITEVLQLSGHKLYALFNNAAYGQPGAIEDLSTAALRTQFENNFFGWHHLTTQLIPHFRQQGEGRIIQNSSILGFAAMKYRGAYNASKFAVEGWTDTLRLELRGSGIEIALIEPGPIETQFRSNALKAFKQWININDSFHKEEYIKQLDRLSVEQSKNSFALPAIACLPSIIDALESPRPNIRYRITKPTKWFAILKRILPTRWLDYILFKAA
jgi:NAD(P)-dependent dehydrogenase (short-subunit alcohol dehydrogenase family)